MDRYDPLVAPDPAAWLALDEQERTRLVEDYHVVEGIEVPRPKAHALPVREKAQQLMAQGLDRHDAIHAIAWVLMHHISDIAGGKVSGEAVTPRYISALRRLNARKWLRSG